MTRFSFQELRESLVIQETRATLARLGPLAKRVSHVLFLSHSNLKQIKHTFDLSGRFCVIKMISFLSFKIWVFTFFIFWLFLPYLSNTSKKLKALSKIKQKFRGRMKYKFWYISILNSVWESAGYNPWSN